MSINLLPWRITHHHNNMKKLCYRSIVCFIITVLFTIGLLKILQNEQQKVIKNTEDYQARSHNLQQILLQIRSLQNNHSFKKNPSIISHNEVEQFLSWLTNLPLQQGELNDLTLTAQNLTIKGNAEDQNEFEQLQEATHQFKLFEQVQLTQFQPKGTQLYFEFHFSKESNE